MLSPASFNSKDVRRYQWRKGAYRRCQVDVDQEVSPNVLKKLKEELRDSLNENEELRQKTHDQNRAFNEATFTIETLTQECTALQLSNDELNLQVSQQQGVISELKKKIKDLDDLNVSAPCPIDDFIEVSGKAHSESHVDVDLIMNENKTLTEEVVLLKTTFSDCKGKLEKLQSRNINLEEIIGEKESQITGLTQQLQLVNNSVVVLNGQLETMQNDLMETVEQLRETKDELAQAQSELHIAKGPVMQSRGNSIFSELEDSRIKYVSKYNDLRSKYADLSKKYARQAQDISKLMSEKVSAARLIEELAKEEELADRSLLDSLELRIRHLEESNKQLKSELKVPVKIISDVDSGTLKYVETLAADTKKAMWTLQKELDDRSIAMLMNQQLTNTYLADLRRYKAENLKLKSVLSCLKSAPDVVNISPKCDQSPKRKVETLYNKDCSNLDALSGKHSHKDLAKVTKKLTFYEDLNTTTGQMQNGEAGVEVCEILGGNETENIAPYRVRNTGNENSNSDERLLTNAPKQVPKPVAKKYFPKLEMNFKK